MVNSSSSPVTEFILTTFGDLPRFQLGLFVVFLFIFIVAITGNLCIIILVFFTIQLQAPMYFFLANLSFLDICLSVVTVPLILKNLLLDVNKRVISYGGCMTQFYFFLTFANAEDFLLAVMAYDRYIAICDPLRYVVVMNRRFCVRLIVICWVLSNANSILQISMTLRLSYCESNLIDHYLCEMVPLMKLSCSDTTINELVIFTEGSIDVFGPLLVILASYVCIIFAICKIHSAAGRKKVFSTCSSHLVLVTFYFGTIIYIYFRPVSSNSLTKDRIASVMYTILTPMLNPFIYTLRNTDVHEASRKICARIRHG